MENVDCWSFQKETLTFQKIGLTFPKTSLTFQKQISLFKKLVWLLKKPLSHLKMLVIAHIEFCIRNGKIIISHEIKKTVSHFKKSLTFQKIGLTFQKKAHFSKNWSHISTKTVSLFKMISDWHFPILLAMLKGKISNSKDMVSVRICPWVNIRRKKIKNQLTVPLS